MIEQKTDVFMERPNILYNIISRRASKTVTSFFFFFFADCVSSVTDLIVFLVRQQVVECFVDRFVVVVLDRSQVRLHQLQLARLVKHRRTDSIIAAMFGSAEGN